MSSLSFFIQIQSNKMKNGILHLLSIQYLCNKTKEELIMKLLLSKTTKRKRYYGFILKPGFWYGRIQKDNTPVAMNGMRRGDMLALYVYKGHSKWERIWIPRDEIDMVYIANNDPITSNKRGVMDFNQWAEEIYTMDQIEKDLSDERCDPSLIIREYLRYVRAEEVHA